MSDLVPSVGSWVRKYFRVENRAVYDELTGTESLIVSYDVCSLPKSKSDDPDSTCGTCYKRNLKNGTKNLLRHVLLMHMDIEEIRNEIATNNISVPQVFSKESLKVAVSKLIFSQNLPFTIIESQAFIELLELCNPAVTKILFKADTLTEHVMKMYWEAKEKVKTMFSNVTSKISITCDIWTSPNSKSILGITCHWIDDNWELKELVLAAVEMRESHTGENIAKLILNTLADYGITGKLFCITADNASNNRTMAKEISRSISSFSFEQHLIGCAGHVFNLVAQAGLKALNYEPQPLICLDSDSDEIVYESEGWGEVNDNVESNEEDNEEEFCDPKSLVDRIRSIVKGIRSSPQKRIQFEDTVKATLPNIFRAPTRNEKEVAGPTSSRPPSARVLASRSSKEGEPKDQVVRGGRGGRGRGRGGRGSRGGRGGRGGRATIVGETFEPSSIPPTVPMTTHVKNPRILGLLLDVKTRWNSTYAMLKRILDLRTAVEVYISSDQKFKDVNLSERDWTLLKDLIGLLKPLYTATLGLSKSKYTSLSLTLPIYIGLYEQINKVTSHVDVLQDVASDMQDKLDCYYQQALNKTVFANAALLDPRIKSNFLKGQANKKTVLLEFKKEAEPFENYVSDAVVQSSDDEEWISRVFKKRKVSNLDSEIKRYLTEDVIEEYENPLIYWELKKKIFPSLSAMAKSYLAIPSTSTPSERAFSSGRLLIHYTRSCLSPEKICGLLCLNNWYSNNFC